jgi:hypothetical protein
MSTYAIELNERVKYFSCPHCGEKSVTVWGSVLTSSKVHAIYYANLMTGCKETNASVRLTISFGGWGENNSEDRWWILIEARPTIDSYEMMVREPEESLYFGEKLLGRGVSRTEALASDHKDDFFAVADCIAFNDPAVKSYLSGKVVSFDGRHVKV